MRFMQNPIVQKVTFVLAVLFVVDLACTLLLGWRYPAKVRFLGPVGEIAPPPGLIGKSKIVENPEGGVTYPGPDEFVPYDEPPVPLKEAEYKYPRSAKEAGFEGTVWVKVLVDTKGYVRDAVIAKHSGLDVGFEKAAIEGALKARYKPAIGNNQPVAVWVVYPVRFSLK